MKTLKFILILIGTLLTLQSYSADIDVAYGRSGIFNDNGTITTLPSGVTDENKTTIAKSFMAYQNVPYLIIDLGQNYDLSSITFYWGGTNYATQYSVCTSADNSTWISNLRVTNNTLHAPSSDPRTFSPNVYGVRYVKVYNFTSNSQVNPYLVDIIEIEVYGHATTCSNDGTFKKLIACDVATFNSSATFGGAVTVTGGLSAASLNSPNTMYLQTGGTNRMYISSSNGLVNIYNDLTVSGIITTGNLTSAGTITAGNLTSNGNIKIATTAAEALTLCNPNSLQTTNYIGFRDHWANVLGQIGMDNSDNLCITKLFAGGLNISNQVGEVNISSIFNVNISSLNFKVYQGSLYARQVIVTTNVFPDFVFKKDYKLKSLTETESYIKTNGHLEGVPTEAEAKEKGINVAEMNATLLKKIEEITLLMIEQDKIIKQQGEEIKNLKKVLK